jgi:hypothetical protein
MVSPNANRIFVFRPTGVVVRQDGVEIRRSRVCDGKAMGYFNVIMEFSISVHPVLFTAGKRNR